MITGNYWIDALGWALGGGSLGYILGTCEVYFYRRVHHDEPQS